MNKHDIDKLIEAKKAAVRLIQHEIEDLETRLYIKSTLKKLENVKHH